MNQVEWQVRVDLAACYRLCALNGWDDTIYTHVSASLPGEPGRFLINEFGLRFDEISASNLVKIDLEGNVVGGVQSKVNVTGFAIHGAVHAARSDAHCVMHLHNTPTIAVGIQEQGLLPISQHALRFYSEIGYHHYEGLALSPQEQGRMLEALGERHVLMLRNHGTIVSGRSVAEAYVLMETLDRACRIQIQAQAGGGKLLMPSAELCEETHRELVGDGSPEGTLEWPALLRKLDDIDASYRT
jgi:ribulose-5-phosphate 4-epimerase/fuculose-1-phosphate aldolase